MTNIDVYRLPTAIVGTTGSGKTYAAKGVVERLIFEGRRVVIIDPTGAWWGLRSGADGSEDGGLPVTIFGGDHGDIPLSPDAGDALGRALAPREVHAIIDVSEMTGGQKNRFLTAFFEAFYASNKSALHLIVDEADEVAPQNPMPESRHLFGIFDKIVRRGRIKGFRPMMITQRPAVIHKNVLSQIGTMVALKLVSPQDIKAITDWVKGAGDLDKANEVTASLSGLGNGEGWVWSPADDVLERGQFPSIKTFDSSRTPGDDEVPVEPALGAVDLGDLLEAFSGVDEPATEPAQKSAKSDDYWERKIDHAMANAFADGNEKGFAEGYAHAMSHVESAIGELKGDTPETPPQVRWSQEDGKCTTGAKTARKRPSTKKEKAKPPADGLTAPAQRFLDQVHALWPARMTWSQITLTLKMKARGGHFNHIRKQLLDGGHVQEVDNLVVPTVAPDKPGLSPLETFRSALPSLSRDILDTLIERGPMTAEQIAEILGKAPRGGHWNHGMALLKQNGLIVPYNGGWSADGKLVAEARS